MEPLSSGRARLLFRSPRPRAAASRLSAASDAAELKAGVRFSSAAAAIAPAAPIQPPGIPCRDLQTRRPSGIITTAEQPMRRGGRYSYREDGRYGARFAQAGGAC